MTTYGVEPVCGTCDGAGVVFPNWADGVSEPCPAAGCSGRWHPAVSVEGGNDFPVQVFEV